MPPVGTDRFHARPAATALLTSLDSSLGSGLDAELQNALAGGGEVLATDERAVGIIVQI